MRPLRVLHALSDYHMFGAGRYLEVLVQGLGPSGSDSQVETVVACPSGGEVELMSRRLGLEMVPLPDRDRSYSYRNYRVLLSYLLSRECSQRGLDIVHTHACLSAALASRSARKGKVIMTRHRLSGLGQYPAMKKAQVRLFGWLSDLVVAVSRSVEEDLLSQGWPAAKVRRVTSGLDLGKWPLRPQPDPDNPVVAMTARMNPEKGHSVLLQAMPLILQHCPRTRFLLLGHGPLMEKIREELASLGISDRVRLAGYRSDLPDLYRHVLVGVAPSLSEAFGFAAAEFMASGIPVVASDVGGHRELMEDQVSGLLVPRGNPVDLAVAVIRLLSDPELAQKLGAGGRRRIQEEFTADVMAQKMISCYRELVGWSS